MITALAVCLASATLLVSTYLLTQSILLTLLAGAALVAAPFVVITLYDALRSMSVKIAAYAVPEANARLEAARTLTTQSIREFVHQVQQVKPIHPSPLDTFLVHKRHVRTDNGHRSVHLTADFRQHHHFISLPPHFFTDLETLLQTPAHLTPFQRVCWRHLARTITPWTTPTRRYNDDALLEARARLHRS